MGLFLFFQLLCTLPFPGGVTADEVPSMRLGGRADFLDLYDPGIPRNTSVEWAFPTGISLGLSGGYLLQDTSLPYLPLHTPSKVNYFPLSFLMKVSLFETDAISQSMGVGFGPCFLYKGKVPIQMSDLEVTGMTTCLTEWVSHITKDLYLNLVMKYSQAFESLGNQLPLQTFSTWMGLNAQW